MAVIAYDEHYRSGGFGYAAERAKWEKWVGRHYVHAFGLTPGDRLLDAGCGDGFWTSVFHAAGLETTGFDLSTGGIEVARSQFPDSTFVVADVEKPLPFEPGSFDVVFCRSISHLCRRELLTAQTLDAMQSLATCVAAGGLLLISYFSRRDGLGTDSSPYHRVSDLVRVVEPFLDPFRVEVADDYVQIGAQRRDAPRARQPPTPAG